MNNDKQQKYKVGVMPVGIALTIIISAILGYNLLEGDKSFYLGGDTSHGHYQIELECESCHGPAFSGENAMQRACESCHAEELEKVNDSHPKKVFLDPRNSDLLAVLDATKCVSCHREHKPEITRDYGVTLAADFCFHCHQDIQEERPSHQDFEFKTCATSGCHNFHDNSMLYEKFLAKNLDQPAIKKKPILPERTALARWIKRNKVSTPLTVAKPDLEHFTDNAIKRVASEFAPIVDEWKSSIHAKTNANCSSCHKVVNENRNNDDKSMKSHLGSTEIAAAKNSGMKPSDQSHASIDTFAIKDASKACQDCHKKQHEDFLESKHGMRLALGLDPMTTKNARLDLTPTTKIMNCTSCHNPHNLNITLASTSACLDCHKDDHSQNFKNSKHYELWANEILGNAPKGTGVSCATCHLPRVKKGKRVAVVHNQNSNLRPNIKMLRTVCMNCHGAEFSIAALADKKLIESNFIGQPDSQHATFELIRQRMKKR